MKRTKEIRQCEAPGCTCQSTASWGGKRYCNRHWLRLYNNGTLEPQPRKRTNEYTISGDLLRIKTAKGVTIYADAADYDKLSKHSWCISKTGYPVANIGHRTVKLHRYLLDIPTGMVCDHINNNPLDNRRCNLRICTSQENARNRASSASFHGVRKTLAGNYSVRITRDRKEIYIGTFKTYEEAVEARLRAEDLYHGEFGYHHSSPAITTEVPSLTIIIETLGEEETE